MDNQIYLMNRYQKDPNTIAYAFNEEIVLIRREYIEDGTAALFEITINIESNKAKTKRRISDAEMKADEFETLKKILTETTKEEHKTDVKISRRNCSLDKLENTDMVCLPSVEDEYIKGYEAEDDPRTIENAMTMLSHCLTDIQKTRFIRNKYCGETTREIAASEGISQAAVFKSIELSEKKIRNFQKSVKTGLSKP
jgi:hypothetical protein